MNSICITGASQPDLQHVSNILYQAGMALPRSAKHDESIGLAFWHEQVVAMLLEKSDNVQFMSSPGSVWEQLASDIFLANIDSKLWGWADSRSTWLLDFWLNFEPRLNFILVYVSPQKMLARAMTTATEAISVETVMSAWQIYHEELLRFHHRNPSRSLFVEAQECAEHPGALIERCVAQWKLPLTLATDEPPFSNKEPDSLALYLAHQLCRAYPQAASIQNEVIATITRLGKIEQVVDVSMCTPDPALIIAEYHNLLDRSAKLERMATVRVELDALKLRFDEARADYAQQQNVLEHKVKQANQENELLISQLYQLQEEFEAISLKNTAMTDALKAAETKINEAEQENKLLLLQRHQVQEELEHHFLRHQNLQKQQKASEIRWQRMLQRTPDYFDYESIEILSTEDSEGNVTTWGLKNFNAAGYSSCELEFKTFLEQGIAGFVLPILSRITGRLSSRLADLSNHQDMVVLIPIGGPENISQRLETLIVLATRDWYLLQTLIRLLRTLLETPAALNAPTDFRPEALRNGLVKLGEIIEKLPTKVRYDSVTLKREQVNPDYEHLWLRFENLAFNGKRWPEFEFRLSCAHVGPGRFGGYPKLEFPQNSSEAPFECWFIEAYDDFGAKLELRFALPEPSMDIVVWHRVSENDRAFLSGLIERLPAILLDLRNAGVNLRRSWDDWVNMVLEMQRVAELRKAAPAMVVPVWTRMTREIKRIAALLRTTPPNSQTPIQAPSTSKTFRDQ